MQKPRGRFLEAWKKKYGSIDIGNVLNTTIPNDDYKEMGLLCPWQHCVNVMPFHGGSLDEYSCPFFGRDCPDGKEQVAKCRGGEESDHPFDSNPPPPEEIRKNADDPPPHPLSVAEIANILFPSTTSRERKYHEIVLELQEYKKKIEEIHRILADNREKTINK